MKTSLRTLFLTFVFTMLCTAMAFAYNPGQRTIHLLGDCLLYTSDAADEL